MAITNADKERRRPDRFPKPYIQRTGAEYLAYLRAWMGRATTAAGVVERYKAERDIRNRLGVPLTQEQLEEAVEMRDAALARLGERGGDQ